jgi:hypothetical protein
MPALLLIFVDFLFQDAGSAKPSFVRYQLENGERKSEQQLRTLKLAAAGIYGGGTETVGSSAYLLFIKFNNLDRQFL